MKKENKLEVGTAFGILIGTIIGISTDDLGLWISLGMIIGAGVGTTLMEKDKKSKDDSL